MCIQTISISSDSNYLNYLNDCEESKLYPPLRLYEDNDFIWIDGLDSKKASISKVGFSVNIDDLLYTNLDAARLALLSNINAVNFSGDPIIGAEKVVYVSDVSHLPTAVGGDINLLPTYTYIFTTKVDLKGARLVSADNTVILGYSSENCGIFSTGLSTSSALLKANSTIVLKYIEFKGVGVGQVALDIDCTGNRGGNAAFDWIGVNFVDLEMGSIKEIDNFIFNMGVLSGNLSFDENFDSIVIVDSLLQASTGNIISWEPTAICNRRIRIQDSAVVLTGTANGFNASTSMAIENESYILEKVNFSNLGSGDSVTGIDSTSNKAFFASCKGISNTSSGGSMFAKGNALVTSIASQSVWVKVNTVTTLTPDTQKFSHSNNRMTCEAAIQRNYLIVGNVSFSTTNNRICKIGILHSKSLDTDNIIPMSIVTQEADGAGRAQSVPFQATIAMVEDTGSPDYIEIWVQMTNGTNDITFEDLTVSIIESK